MIIGSISENKVTDLTEDRTRFKKPLAKRSKDYCSDSIDKPMAKKKKSNNMNFDFGKTIPKNELDLRFDFSYRDDRTVNHILDQEQSVATRGMKTIRISPSIDYIINNRLTIRLFYDYSRTIPAVSNSFPITNSKMGVTVRFSLSQ